MAIAGGADRVSRRLAEVGSEFGHGFALELGRVEAALAAIGAPHHRLPPVLHVAGTNGKGSTCAFLRAIAEAAGLRAHVFTSPHLIRPNERIRLAGKLVEDEAFIAALDRLAATGLTVTYFEAVTAAALDLFARTPADVVIVEVGLGGRFDATNVVRPAVSVIAPVDFDHMAFLGDTLAKIAGEKAGIIKPGAPVVVARQAGEAMAVIEAEAERHDAPIARAGIEWDAYAQHGRLIVQTGDALHDLPAPGLIGPHQYDNAGLAVVAALALGDPRIDADSLAQGVAQARWPGRMQRLTRGPAASRAATAGVELWLDGAHNPHGAQAVVRSLAQLHARDPRPTAAIVGMLASKDAAGFVGALAEGVSAIACVPVPGAKGQPPEALAALARAAGCTALLADSEEAALAALLNLPEPPGRVIICGSLYLAGAVLAGAGGLD